ncbi:hypothetical protein KU392_00670 [Advenella alkanexedens]|uniref:Uncharacterized protein n=1 Tax=Advenella alkanexedens TaxID=1481665 RepID=A0ABS6NJF6_9BURK|nr:hypothetical protein [Advenella alkanexedens]MBV4395766.1 hypothetical protein [Advenella alkanexedens]
MIFIFYFMLAFISLATIPFAFPVILIFAIVHLLEINRSNKQKKIIVKALKEAGLSAQPVPGAQKNKSAPSFLKILIIVFIIVLVLAALQPN